MFEFRRKAIDLGVLNASATGVSFFQCGSLESVKANSTCETLFFDYFGHGFVSVFERERYADS